MISQAVRVLAHRPEESRAHPIPGCPHGIARNTTTTAHDFFITPAPLFFFPLITNVACQTFEKIQKIPSINSKSPVNVVS